MFQAATAARTEGKPSTMKRRRQGAMGLSWANLTMTQARVDAKLVARGAAINPVSLSHPLFTECDIPDIKMAVRKASSSRLKKKLR